jgi:hypothetical protein
MNNALIRPLVAYMNANKTKISLECSAKIDIVTNFKTRIISTDHGIFTLRDCSTFSLRKWAIHLSN